VVEVEIDHEVAYLFFSVLDLVEMEEPMMILLSIKQSLSS